MSTVWGTLISGDSPTGLGTATVTGIGSGLGSTVETDSSKAAAVPWQYEVVVDTASTAIQIGIRDSFGRLCYLAGNGDLLNENGTFAASTTALVDGDIITLVFDAVDDNVDFYKNGTLIGAADNGGYGDPVSGHATIGANDQLTGVWSTLTHGVGGVGEWDAAAPDPATEVRRTLVMVSSQEVSRILWMPMRTRVSRTIVMAAAQEIRRTLKWHDVTVVRRTIVAPIRQGITRTIVATMATGPDSIRRTLYAAMSATDTVTVRRALVVGSYLQIRRTLHADMAIPAEVRRTLVAAMSAGATTARRTIRVEGIATDAVTVRRTLVLAVQSRGGITVTGALRLIVRGRPVEILSGEIWADEGSPYWQSSITLLRPEDYGRLTVGTAYELDLYGTRYAQIVDTRSLSRGFSGDRPGDSATIGGLSPLALQGGRWGQAITRTWDAPVLASVVADDLLGSVAWGAVDWLIPAYRLAAQGQTPLEIVSTLAAAAGAALESAPDGSLSVRALYPVRAVDMAQATPDATLGDDEIYSVSESPEAVQVVNQVRVTDGTAEADGYQDRIEFESDEDDPQSGTIRAYPLPWREGITLRSTRSRVRLYRQGEATREVDETVEVRDGVASIQYPPLTLVSAEYLDTDLGALVVAGSEVRTAAHGWGLLRLVYSVRAIEYRAVSLDPDLSALVVMEDGAS